MFKNKKLLSIILVTFMLFSVTFFTSCSKKEDLKKKTIRIACNLPLTGGFASWGSAIKDGVMMFQNGLKEKDEEIVLDYDWQDNLSTPKNAVNILNKQFLNPPDIYISGIKPQTMAIIDKISKKQTPHFVWVFDAFVCKMYNNTFRTLVNYKYEPEQFIKYAKKIQPNKVSIIYVNLPHAQEEIQKILIPSFNKMGIENIMTETYNYNKKDYKDIAIKVKDYNPDLIILNGFKATIIGLVKSLRNLNLIKNGNTIVTYDMLDAAEELSNDMSENIRVVAPLFNFNIETDKRIVNWKEKFKKIYGKKPLYSNAYAFDMANIIYDVSKRIIFPISNEKLSKALLSTEIDGITGPLKFDKDGDLLISIQVGVYKNGKLIPEVFNK